MNQTDEELVELGWGGDVGAFRELVVRYQDRLMAFIYSIVRDYHRAEDIFQETFIRVYRQARQFQSGRSFKTWLYAIARNRCRDELRSAKRQPTLELEAGLDRSEEEKGTRWIDTVEAGGPSPRELAGGRELEKMFLEALAGLSEEHREVVVMSRLLGLKYDEIAEVLGIPSGTVRSRLHYALEYLRRKMLKNEEILPWL